MLIKNLLFGKKNIVEYILDIYKYKKYRKLFVNINDFEKVKNSVDSNEKYIKEKKFYNGIVFKI